jgi:hypothetical protein
MARPWHATVTPAAELTWRLAGTAERRAEAEGRIEALATMVRQDDLAAEMDRQRSRLILGERARRMGITSAGFDADLEAFRHWADLRAMLFEGLTRRAAQQLEDAGIPALPLKGTTLADSAHGEPSARTSGDIDLLVARRQLADAVTALADLGYEPDPGEPRSAVHVVLKPADLTMPRIEVHWRVHWYGDSFAQRMLAESRIGPNGLREATPTSTLAALLLFYAKDGLAGLRLPIDIAGFLARHRTLISAADVLAEADHDPEIYSALVTAASVAQDVVGVDLGAPLPRLSAREDRAARLANWSLGGGADQTRATVRLVDALLAPEGTQVRFVKSRLRPFSTPVQNALYVTKTLLRWVPALASTSRGRRPHELPSL